MKKTVLTIKEEGIFSETNPTVLQYWDKMLLHIIEQLFNEYEERIGEIIEDDGLEEYYDLLEHVGTEIEAGSIDYSEMYSELMTASVNSLVTKNNLIFKFDGKEVKIPYKSVEESALDFFKIQIFPFLKMDPQNEVLLDADDAKEQGVVIAEILKNIGFQVRYIPKSEKGTLNSLHIKYQNQIVLSIKKGSQSAVGEFTVHNDVNEKIGLKAYLLGNESEEYYRDIDIYFPFFRKGDYVDIEMDIYEGAMRIVATHRSSNIKFLCRV